MSLLSCHFCVCGAALNGRICPVCGIYYGKPKPSSYRTFKVDCPECGSYHLVNGPAGCTCYDDESYDEPHIFQPPASLDNRHQWLWTWLSRGNSRMDFNRHFNQ